MVDHPIAGIESRLVVGNLYSKTANDRLDHNKKISWIPARYASIRKNLNVSSTLLPAYQERFRRTKRDNAFKYAKNPGMGDGTAGGSYSIFTSGATQSPNGSAWTM